MARARRPQIRERETVALDDLKPHPRNYRTHPEDQRRHLVQSMREHGFYRNLVIAKDGTILAGHGVWEAAKEVGLAELPVVRLPIKPDDPRALKILVADNELGKGAETDDRLLTELLRETRDVLGLLGTGYDDAMLANLLFVTRPVSEIQDQDAAAHWVGLPEYEKSNLPPQLLISFETEEERDRLLELIESEPRYRKGRVWLCWWPNREREDPGSLRWSGNGEVDPEAVEA